MSPLTMRLLTVALLMMAAVTVVLVRHRAHQGGTAHVAVETVAVGRNTAEANPEGLGGSWDGSGSNHPSSENERKRECLRHVRYLSECGAESRNTDLED